MSMNRFYISTRSSFKLRRNSVKFLIRNGSTGHSDVSNENPISVVADRAPVNFYGQNNEAKSLCKEEEKEQGSKVVEAHNNVNGLGEAWRLFNGPNTIILLEYSRLSHPKPNRRKFIPER